VDLLAADPSWIHALPVLACKAIEEKPSDAVPAAAAWITLVHASNVLDIIQDGDAQRLAQFQSPQLAYTVAIAWIFSPFNIIDNPSYDSEIQNKITRIFSSAGIDSSIGQYRGSVINSDKSNAEELLEGYWNAVIMKSGSIFKAGIAAGAIVGGGSEEVVEALGDYGTALGVIRQVMDDCRDVWKDIKAAGKYQTLPTLLQKIITENQRFKHREKSIKAKKETEFIDQPNQVFLSTDLPEIITDILFEWRRRALESLNQIKPSEARKMLEAILDQAMMPGTAED
jgi:geranylgeranyl pyrophosphate synthase